MAVAEAQGIWKRFDGRDVSFTVEPGDILGMVGPNGAGKTTTIRMLLDIIQADRGEVLLFGERFAHKHRALLGYLPEERGLYRELSVVNTLAYLGRLKGLQGPEARTRADEILERVGMSEHRDKKVKELSRGMSQLIQMAATVLHHPQLLVLDEPFSGLDPVNTRVVQELLQEMRQDEGAIVLSTHQMNQVEELCDRVLMINDGQDVLYGAVDEVRRGFGVGSVLVESSDLPGELPGVRKVTDHGTYRELVMEDGAASSDVFRALAEHDVDVRRFEVAALPLEEIFFRVVESERS